jgi:hypothetical protein
MGTVLLPFVIDSLAPAACMLVASTRRMAEYSSRNLGADGVRVGISPKSTAKRQGVGSDLPPAARCMAPRHGTYSCTAADLDAASPHTQQQQRDTRRALRDQLSGRARRLGRPAGRPAPAAAPSIHAGPAAVRPRARTAA